MRCEIPVSRETGERWQCYERLLKEWQKKINLVSSNTLSNAYGRHFLDSLQLAQLIPDIEARILDLGAGAGFPGMVLAIAGYNNVHLVESDMRKVAFIREVSLQTGVGVDIYPARIEQLVLPKMHYITARALAPLTELLFYAETFLSDSTICLFLKGQNHTKEIQEARKGWRFEIEIHPSLTNQAGVVMQLRDIRRL